MRNCIDSLLTGGEEVEILIVDDGSKDATPQIADEYAEKYPSIVRAVHQPNGGHGEAVNAGLRHASGFFYKVVDSDDWVDQESYERGAFFPASGGEGGRAPGYAHLQLCV